MKPDVDPNAHPKAMAFVQARLSAADDDQRAVENATMPIYNSIPTHRLPQQVGSGVLLRIDDQYFVLSATHVFEHVEEWALMLGRPAHEEMAPIGGERFVSGKQSDAGSDRFDASVFHIQAGLTESLRSIAIGLEHIDKQHVDTTHTVHGAVGYFSKRSKTIGRETYFAVERLMSHEHSQSTYAQLGFDRSTHIALAYEDQVWVDGRWQQSPTPKGFSGGAIVRYNGVSLDPRSPDPDCVTPVLAGVTIERHKEVRRERTP